MDFRFIFDRLFKIQSAYNEDNKTSINKTEEENISTLLSVVSSCHRFFMSTKFAHDTEMQLQVYQLSTYWMDIIQAVDDKFCLYATQKAYETFLMNIKSKDHIEEHVTFVVNITVRENTKIQSKIVVLEILSDIIKSEDESVHCIKNVIMDIFTTKFEIILNSLTNLSKSNSFEWENYFSSFLSCYINIMKRTQKHIYDSEKSCISVCFVNMLTKHLDVCCHQKTKSSTFWKILHALNVCFPYGDKLSLQINLLPSVYDWAESVLKWMYKTDFSIIPIDTNKYFDGRKIIPRNSTKDISNLSDLRSFALLVIRVAAVLNKTTATETEARSSKRLFQCLDKLDKYVTSLLPTVRSQFEWVSHVFGDQDDTLVEVHLALLDIYTNTLKLGLSHDDQCLQLVGNPHKHFYKLICMCQFDSSLVLDWLTSPETCFLLYLIKYLKFIINNWSSFQEIHRNLTFENHNQKDRCATDVCTQMAVTVEATLESEDDSQVLNKTSSRGLLLIGGYGSDDDDDDDDDNDVCLHEIEGEPYHEEIKFDTLNCENEAKLQSNDFKQSTCGQNKFNCDIKNTPCNQMTCQTDVKLIHARTKNIECDNTAVNQIATLDDVMSILIRIHYKLEHLNEANLLQFNSSALIKLIIQCDELYQVE